MEEQTNTKEKKEFVPKPGTKKEKAYELFKTDKTIQDISIETGATISTVRTWKNVWNKANKKE